MHCCNTDSEIQHADHGQTHLRFAWAGLPSCRASSLCSLLKLLYFRHLKMNITLTDHTSIILLRNGLLRNTLDIINVTKTYLLEKSSKFRFFSRISKFCCRESK